MKIFFALLLISFGLQAKTVEVSVKLSPAGSFKAESTKVRGAVTKSGNTLSAGELTVQVGSLKTGLDLRDKHFHERLGGSEAKIVVKNAKGSGGKGQGTITVNQITKPLTFVYTEAAGSVSAVFTLSAADFGIKNVSYLGVGVEDKLSIKAQIPIR